MRILIYFTLSLWLSINHVQVFAQEVNTEQANASAQSADPALATSSEKSSDKTNANPSDQATTNSESMSSVPTALGSGSIAEPMNALLLQQNDLKHYLPNKNIKALQLGMQEHLVLIEENKISQSKGVMILLPNWQQNATGSSAINSLRTTLPRQGWTTLTIQPPSKPDHYPSVALERDKQQQDNLKLLTEYQEELAQIVSQVSQLATDYPGVIIMVAEGSHGALMTSIYQRQLSPAPTALILLSSALATTDDDQRAAEHLTELSMPVLDVKLSRDSNQVLIAQQLRNDMVQQQLKSFYRQKTLTNQIPSEYPPQALITTINGWLASLGW